MKTEIEFNYETENRFEAMGLDKEEFASQLAKVILGLSQSEKENHKASSLIEAIHTRMDYKGILFLATTSVLNFMMDSGIAEETE